MTRSYARAAFVLLLAYVVLVVAVAAGWLRVVDLALSGSVHFSAPCWALNAAQTTSVLFEGYLSLIYAGLLALLCLHHRKPLPGIIVVGFLLLTVAVELLSKLAISQLPPQALFVPRSDCRSASFGLMTVEMPNSLPSGFAIRLAYFGVLLAALGAASGPRVWTEIRFILLPLIALLAATRVLLAWHWTSDVVAGLLLGAAAACAVLSLVDGFSWLRPLDNSCTGEGTRPGPAP
jgi:membrane-associated phospholipid phosphatase